MQMARVLATFERPMAPLETCTFQRPGKAYTLRQSLIPEPLPDRSKTGTSNIAVFCERHEGSTHASAAPNFSDTESSAVVQPPPRVGSRAAMFGEGPWLPATRKNGRRVSLRFALAPRSFSCRLFVLQFDRAVPLHELGAIKDKLVPDGGERQPSFLFWWTARLKGRFAGLQCVTLRASDCFDHGSTSATVRRVRLILQRSSHLVVVVSYLPQGQLVVVTRGVGCDGTQHCGPVSIMNRLTPF